MGLRFRKSIKIFPGVKLNFNKKSIGLSFGTRGARVSVNSDGRKTTSVGLPGTGLYWTDSRKNPRKDDEVSFFGCFMWILLLPFILVYNLIRWIFIGIGKLFKFIFRSK